MQPVDASHFDELIGPVEVHEQDGAIIHAITLGQRHLNLAGYGHGGMLLAFADMIMGLAAFRACKQPCATISLNGDLVGNVKLGEKLSGSAEILRTTRSIVFARAQLRTEERPVLVAQGLWKIIGAS